MKKQATCTFKQFTEKVLGDLQAAFPKKDFSITEIAKLQKKYTGVRFDVTPENFNGCGCEAAIDLSAAYDKHLLGMDYDEVFDAILSGVESASDNVPDVRIADFSNYETMKTSLSLQLIPVKGNEKVLAETPHRIIEDLALVARFHISESDNGIATATVTDSMLAGYGIDSDTLFADALKYAPVNAPAKVEPLADIIEAMTGVAVPDVMDLLVATVESGHNGAAVLCYPGFMEEMAERIGGDYYILPSSIHEIITVPGNCDLSPDELTNMVRSINCAEVAPEDRLSDNVYFYDAINRVFSVVSTSEDESIGEAEENTD